MFKSENLYGTSVDVYADTDSDCEAAGCDEEGICRCSRVVGVHVSPKIANANNFFCDFYIGKGSLVDKALDHWWLRQNWGDLDFDWNSEGDYYGEVLTSVRIASNTFFREAEKFSVLSTKEKVHSLLMKEYGEVLPKVAAVEEWQVKAVFNSDVINSPNKNLDEDRADEYVDLFQKLVWQDKTKFQDNTLPFAPLCMPVNKKYQVVDGRHRTTAMGKEYYTAYNYTRRQKKNDTEVFFPIYMWIICPKEK